MFCPWVSSEFSNFRRRSTIFPIIYILQKSRSLRKIAIIKACKCKVTFPFIETETMYCYTVIYIFYIFRKCRLVFFYFRTETQLHKKLIFNSNTIQNYDKNKHFYFRVKTASHDKTFSFFLWVVHFFFHSTFLFGCYCSLKFSRYLQLP